MKMSLSIRVAQAAVLCIAFPHQVLGFDAVLGKRVYDQHCASCHGLDGRSRFPDVPELRSQSVGSLPGVDAVNRLKTGGQRKPPFMGRLTDQELMDALIYARTLR